MVVLIGFPVSFICFVVLSRIPQAPDTSIGLGNMLSSKRHASLIFVYMLSNLLPPVLSSQLLDLEEFEHSIYQQSTLPPAIENPRKSHSSFSGDNSGDSPFFYCPESDPENDLFAIDTLVLNPNPPHMLVVQFMPHAQWSYQLLTRDSDYVYVFHAHGFFREDIRDPFHVKTTVKREDRNGLNFTLDFDVCELADAIEMDGRSTHCPPFKGYSTIHKFEFVDFGIPQVRSLSITGFAKHILNAWEGQLLSEDRRQGQ